VLVVALALVATVAPSAEAAATEDEYLERRGIRDKVLINLGGILARFDTAARIETESLPGSPSIDLESILGLADEQRDFRIEGHYRFSRKHRFDFSYMSLGRGNTMTLDESFEFDGYIWGVGAEVDSVFNTKLFETSYTFSFVNNGKIDAGFKFGLSTIGLELGISGTGNITTPEGDLVEGVAAGGEKFLFPVPTLGFHVAYTIRPRLFFRASGEIFEYSANDLGVRWTDGRASVDWYPWKHVGFSGGYTMVKIKYVEGEQENLEIKYEFGGLMAYVSFVWGGPF
jgi:hypothetical protein